MVDVLPSESLPAAIRDLHFRWPAKDSRPVRPIWADPVCIHPGRLFYTNHWGAMNSAASLTNLLNECVGLRIGQVRVQPWSMNFGPGQKNAPARNSGKIFSLDLIDDGGSFVRSLKIEVDDTEDGASVSWIDVAT